MAIDACFNPRSLQSDTNLLNEAFATDKIEAVVAVGSSIRSIEVAAKLHESFGARVPYTAGIHPDNAVQEFTVANCKKVEQHVLSQAAAVGECGVDFWSTSPESEEADVQIQCFKWHINLAARARKPLFLHIRNSRKPVKGQRTAVEVALEILDAAKAKLDGIPALVHCFTGNPHAAREFVDRGYFIGFTAFVGYREAYADGARKALTTVVPMSRIVLETDSPHMPPRNEESDSKEQSSKPVDVLTLVETVADMLGVPPDVLASAATANTYTVLQLPLKQ